MQIFTDSGKRCHGDSNSIPNGASSALVEPCSMTFQLETHGELLDFSLVLCMMESSLFIFID